MRAAIVAFTFAALCQAEQTLADPPEIPKEYAAAVERANQAGALIYLHDQAAWHATDELFAHKALPGDERVRGWLTEPYEGDHPGILVTFIGEEGGKTLALYRVRVPSDSGALEYQAIVPAESLDAGQTASWTARTAAAEELRKRKPLCGEKYNVVVLPAKSQGSEGIRVYLLAATTQPDVMIAGGHYLYEYSADGAHLLSERAFTHSCLDLSIKEDPAKGKLKGLALTHLMDPTPTEVHVFMSRNYGKDLYVATTQSKLVWFILDGDIVAARDLGKK